MLGPSGCGKTTTLRMIAGLEAPSSGQILFDGRDFAKSLAFGRNIGMVFQSYALFPHMTLFENVAYGLRVRKLPASAVRERVLRTMSMLGLKGLAERYPADLSGGQQQRVSIARALVYEPGMLLLDEPLANLDAKLRVEMREEIRRLQKQLGILAVYVTHDQEEAMSVSDRLAVFNRGMLKQIGRPEQVYANPSSLFVADFIGKANFLPAVVAMRQGTGAKLAMRPGQEKVVTRLYSVDADEAAQIPPGQDGLVMARPEHVRLARPGDAGFACTISRAQVLGSFIRYVARAADFERDITIETTRPVGGLGEGSAASFDFQAEDAIAYLRGPA